jgi:uncharacterized YceG family protein
VTSRRAMDRDEVDFFGEPDPWDRPSRSERRREEAQRRKRRRRRVVLPLITLVVVAALGAAALIGGRSLTSRFGTTPDYTGSGSGEALVVVKPGDTATDIAATMVSQDVIKSEKAFANAAKQDARALGIQPGTYKLHKQMSGAAALQLILDPSARLLSRVTVPEGLSVAATLKLISEKSKLKLADLQAAANDVKALGLPSYAKGKPEGFLFPDTYDLEPDTTAAGLLKSMVDEYKAKVDDAGLVQKAAAVNLSPYEMVIVASLVEKETQQADERGKVARVIYNRLDQDFFLGIDAAVLYGLNRSSGGLSEADLAKDTPYNNRIHKGLPPTPIANPGIASLQAAVAPAKGPWLYYVLDASHPGHHLFTNDRDVFNTAKAKCQAAHLC